MTHQQSKVLIIGVDGFTWQLGRGFMAAGVIPPLANLTKQGCQRNSTFHNRLDILMELRLSDVVERA